MGALPMLFSKHKNRGQKSTAKIPAMAKSFKNGHQISAYSQSNNGEDY